MLVHVAGMVASPGRSVKGAARWRAVRCRTHARGERTVPVTGRSFRVGLVLGLLAGGGVAAVVTARRRAATPPTPVREPVTPPTPRPVPSTAPVAAGPEGGPAAPGADAAPAAPPEPAPEPAPGPAAEEAAPGAVWTDPLDGGACPGTHPVKAKLTSGIFHLPGMAMYGRTRADRCYVSAEAAEADGLRRSTR